jgi:hypothetical protein
MSLDTTIRKAAQTTLRIFGTSVTLRRGTVGAYDPATGAPAAPATTDTPWKVRLDNYLDRELNDVIRAGDRKATGAAADLTEAPDVDDTLIVGGVEYDIVNVQQEQVKDLPALYILQIRG